MGLNERKIRPIPAKEDFLRLQNELLWAGGSITLEDLRIYFFAKFRYFGSPNSIWNELESMEKDPISEQSMAEMNEINEIKLAFGNPKYHSPILNNLMRDIELLNTEASSSSVIQHLQSLKKELESENNSKKTQRAKKRLEQAIILASNAIKGKEN